MACKTEVTLTDFTAKVAQKIRKNKNRFIIVINNETDDTEPFSLAHIKTDILSGDKSCSVTERPPSRLRPGEGGGILIQQDSSGFMHFKIYYQVLFRGASSKWMLMIEGKISEGMSSECQVLTAQFRTDSVLHSGDCRSVKIDGHSIEIYPVAEHKIGGKHTPPRIFKPVEAAMQISFRSM